MTTKRTEGRRISRIRAFLVSLGVSVVAVSGAYAGLHGLELGLAQPKRVADPSLAARARKLDAYARSLRSSLATKPPPLPAVPRYPAVTIPTIPALPPVARSQEVSTTEAGQASAPTTKPARRPVKIEYVKPAPVVRVVQPPPQAQVVSRGDDDDEHEDHEDHEDHEADD